MKNKVASFKRVGSLLLLFFVASATYTYATEPVKFKVSVDSAVASETLSGRLLIFMRKDDGKPSDGFEPDFTDPFCSTVPRRNT